MKEMEEKLDALMAAYGRQLHAYRSVENAAEQERSLIAEGDMDRLLPLLQAKGETMEAARAEDAEIQRIQQQLAAVFALETFTVSGVLEGAPARYRQRLQALAERIQEVVDALEQLERNESELEGQLRELADTHQGTGRISQSAVRQRARRAYRKEKP